MSRSGPVTMLSASEHSGSWGSEWSDPCDHQEAPTPASASTRTEDDVLESASNPIKRTSSVSSFGISIPSFLQPLLGLDFVPFYPSSADVKQEEDEMSDFEEALMDPYDDDDELPKDDDIALVLDEAMMETPLRKGSSRQRRRPDGRRIKSAFGSTIKAMKRTKSRDGGGSRRLRTNSSSSVPQALDLEWMQQEQEQLAGHQQHLERLETEATAIQQRAGQVENRVCQLRKEALELEQALDRCKQELQHETRSLNGTRQELAKLEEEAMRTGKLVQQTVSNIQKNSERSARKLSGDRKPAGKLSLSNLRKPPLHRERSATDSNVELVPESAHLLLTPPPAANRKSLPDVTTPLAANRPRANTEPKPMLRRLESSPASFMRVSDLSFTPLKSEDGDSPSLSSARSSPSFVKETFPTDGEFLFIDQNLEPVLDSLFQLGYEVVTDESERFAPTSDTRKLLARPEYSDTPEAIDGWPFQPWYAPKNQDLLVWTGGVPHKGHGHDWPVVKARGIVHTTPRNLVGFLLDSSQIKRYNKISKGRFDLMVLQSGVETTAAESDYGFAGDARILRALNKPRMLPKTIEMLSLWYTCQLDGDQHPPGSYMIVSRSVWEDEFATPPADFIRSEMLLGVQLLRPCDGGCELTTITHVYSPGVPEILAKRMAPGSAETMIRDLQEIFRQGCTGLLNVNAY